MKRKEEIRKELEGISPYLAGLEIRPAFKVPKGYFEELPYVILESVSPLAELKIKPAFKVPKNYFESLPDLVLAKVAPQQDTEVVTQPVTNPPSNWLDDLINSVALLFQPRYALRLAVVAVVLIGGFIFLQKGTISTDQGLAVTDANLVNPLAEYGISLDDLNDDDLALLLKDENTGFDASETDLDDYQLNELLKELSEISDEDLEGLL
ncbi:MAG: hypothetical protein ACI8X3_000306 [Saprospiraceae bacterium]|jgi:hypothetical protein